jgi:hypothetical protein
MLQFWTKLPPDRKRALLYAWAIKNVAPHLRDYRASLVSIEFVEYASRRQQKTLEVLKRDFLALYRVYV